ncbi:MAG TPA: hypothetical protein VGD87_05955 [Archangium sp.]
MRWLWILLFLAGCEKFSTVGSTCKAHSECAHFTEGYCSTAGICTRECNTDEQCAEKTVCVRPSPARKICLPSCEASADCPTGFVCLESICQLDAPLEPPAKK